MCVFSAVSDYYTKQWPQQPNQIYPTVFQHPQMDDETKKLLLKAVEILDKIDKKLGDVECHDESKEEFLKQLKGEENAVRHEHRLLDDQESADVKEVKDLGDALLKKIGTSGLNRTHMGAKRRCFDRAFAKVEEAVMWAVKGITV